MEYFNITYHLLHYIFGDETMWCGNRAEIVGYNPIKNLHIVIDDGMCRTEDGKYCFHIYIPEDINHKTDWMPNIKRKHPLKYIQGKKIVEQWINLKDEDEVNKLKEFIRKQETVLSYNMELIPDDVLKDRLEDNLKGSMICECGTLNEDVLLHPIGWDEENNEMIYASKCKRCGTIMYTRD